MGKNSHQRGRPVQERARQARKVEQASRSIGEEGVREIDMARSWRAFLAIVIYSVFALT